MSLLRKSARDKCRGNLQKIPGISRGHCEKNPDRKNSFLAWRKNGPYRFQLDEAKTAGLRSQIVILKNGRGRHLDR